LIRWIEAKLQRDTGLAECLKAIIILFGLLYVTGFGSWSWGRLCDAFNDGVGPKDHLAKELPYRLHMFHALQDKVAAAKRLSGNYGMHQYFKDLEELRLYQASYAIWVAPNFAMLQQETRSTRDELSREQLDWERERVFRYYEPKIAAAKAHNAKLLEALRPKKPASAPVTVAVVLSYLLRTYMLLALLMIPVYFIRMAERSGIRPVLKAYAWWQPFVAVLLWPYYFGRYPAHHLRELLAEIELRRSEKKLFRRFSPVEKLRVRMMAASPGFYTWRKQYRLENAHRFRWSFAAALCATLIMVPMAACGSPPAHPRTHHVTVASSHHYVTNCIRAAPPPLLSVVKAVPWLAPPPDDELVLVPERLFPQRRDPQLCAGHVRTIDHVPLWLQLG